MGTSKEEREEVIWVNARETSIVQSVNAIRQMQTLPNKEKKQAWTDGEKFKMMFVREMLLEGERINGQGNHT